MREIVAAGLLSIVSFAAQAATLELSAGSAEGPGWKAREISARYNQGAFRARAARIEATSLPAPLERVEVDCARIETRAPIECRSGRASLQSPKLGKATAGVALRFDAVDRWRLQLRDLDALLSWDDPRGTLAADKVHVRGSATITQSPGALAAELDLGAAAGQGYVEPVFNDFAAQPLRVIGRVQWRGAQQRVAIESLRAEQRGVATLEATGDVSLPEPAKHHRLKISIAGARLAALVETWLKPFLPGTPVDDVVAQGAAEGAFEIVDGQPVRAEFIVRDAAFDAAKLGVHLEGLGGTARWAGAEPAETRLAWKAGKAGKLPLGPAQLAMTASTREVRLLEPLRVPLLDGAIRIERFVLRDPASPERRAEFAAAVEPIELRELCRALGWPEFGGQLSGTLPGLRYEDNQLVLDGELRAQAFDGDVRLRGLRIIEPLGVLPRVLADLELRGLDLEKVTGAFSFGRIEGRLDAEVTGLRLLGWKPVAMNARLFTPPDDDSRHRISQRAIDTISSIGGGPSGILSRGVMRFFDDFAYDRIGWSCQLQNGVCRMDGIGPSRDGNGYVIVKGKLLPRIDVVGYTREVAFDTLVERLKNARGAPAPVVE